MLRNLKLLKCGFTCWSTKTWYTRGPSLLNYVTHKSKSLRVEVMKTPLKSSTQVWVRVLNEGPVYYTYVDKCTLTLGKPKRPALIRGK